MSFNVTSLQNDYYLNLKDHIDFSVPFWYIPYLTSIGLISLVLNNAVLLLIIFKSEKIDNFKYFLLALQVSCMMTDFHLSILCQPMIYLPIWTTNCLGVAASAVWCNSLIALEQGFNTFQYACLLFCFMRRHQTLAKIMNKHVIPATAFKCLMITGFSFSPLGSFFWYHAGIAEDLLPGFVNLTYPEFKAEFSNLKNFTIHQLNIYMFLVGVCGFLGIFGVFQVIAMTTVDTMKMLKGARRTISAQSYNRQKSALRSLTAQFLASTLMVLPASSFFVIMTYPIKYGQDIINVSMAIFATRSSVNAVILVVTTPPYRAFLFGRVMSNRQKPSTVVVSINHTA
ncbi:Serpentine Receptor, class I [Caenorhabditis elegans]|uniref:Serpentine Receptor, class I n=1 Tax=Caenorhabditis elegans TaxID=6239 RepID=O16690_CAEEL|nr:Serpentine Receptor, class I [Caenorhabditis elegans]CCD72760.1 Serpentine Receptor, class I [Caenorhabditis elegans]|eukprot:NP_493782.2 Serpentine Receptor, class I [Caenorhabditis elegans]